MHRIEYWINDVRYESDHIDYDIPYEQLIPRDNDLPNLIHYFDDSKTFIKYEYWYKDGLPHRIIGPATIYYRNDRFGYCEWFINGKRIENEWFEDHKIHILNPSLAEQIFIKMIWC